MNETIENVEPKNVDGENVRVEIRTITLRDKLNQELSDLYLQADGIRKAQAKIISGEVSSYSLDGRSVTMLDLDKLDNRLKLIEDRINEIIAILSGRPLRNRQMCSYMSPQRVLNSIRPYGGFV